MIRKDEAGIELEYLRAAALHAAACTEGADTDYWDLRERARALNRRYELTSDDEFEQMFPSPAGLAEIRRLEAALGSTSRAAACPPDTLLFELAGWAAGMRAAWQTFRR